MAAGRMVPSARGKLAAGAYHSPPFEPPWGASAVGGRRAAAAPPLAAGARTPQREGAARVLRALLEGKRAALQRSSPAPPGGAADGEASPLAAAPSPRLAANPLRASPLATPLGTPPHATPQLARSLGGEEVERLDFHEQQLLDELSSLDCLLDAHARTNAQMTSLAGVEADQQLRSVLGEHGAAHARAAGVSGVWASPALGDDATAEGLYDRNMRWREEVDCRLEWQRALADEAALAQCTFQPNAGGNSSDSCRRLGGEDAHERLHTDAVALLAAREAERERAARERAAREGEQCTFSPDVGSSAASYRSVHGRDSPRRRAPMHCVSGASRATVKALEDAIRAEFGECTFAPTLVARAPKRRSHGEQSGKPGAPGQQERPQAAPAPTAEDVATARKDAEARSRAFLRRQDDHLRRKAEGAERKLRESDRRTRVAAGRAPRRAAREQFFQRLEREEERRRRSAARREVREREQTPFVPTINAASRRLPARSGAEMAAEAERQRARLEQLRTQAAEALRREAPFRPSLGALRRVSDAACARRRRPPSAPAASRRPQRQETTPAPRARTTAARRSPQRRPTSARPAAPAPVATPSRDARWWETSSSEGEAGAEGGSVGAWSDSD